MSRGGGTTLYVTGFGHGTRARDLAYEFERYGRLVRCDIPAPRSASSRLFAFVEYESRRDADDAYHEMHNKRIGRDDLLKIEWARTPPSASWRFDSGRDRPRGERGDRGDRSERGGGRERSPRRRSTSPRREREAFSPRKDDRRERDYERRDRDRSRSPNGDREMKDVRDRDDDRGDRDRDERRDRDREAEAPAEVRKNDSPPPPAAHEDLDVAE
ncbi:RNA-binding domain-containing protein [Phaeosphaeriaceae sp. SRC1lsM3a]|nr:RNA-binding domain-containing protein [Stagonospora sp. SRC1lsM3a]